METLATDRAELVERMVATLFLAGDHEVRLRGTLPAATAAPEAAANPSDCRAGAQSTAEAILRRRSVRHFAPDSLSLAHLRHLLDAAYSFDEESWPEECQAGLGIDFLVVASRVDSLAPGVYAARPDEELVLVSPISEGDALEFVVQREFAAAPAILVAVGQLADALARHGQHGYRVLATRAGAAAHAACLAAVSRGLGSTIFGGVVDSAARRFGGVDGTDRCPLVGLAVGYAQPD